MEIVSCLKKLNFCHDGNRSFDAPAGMTHGVRDENDFMVTSEKLSPFGWSIHAPDVSLKESIPEFPCTKPPAPRRSEQNNPQPLSDASPFFSPERNAG
jgi:hypothetical protein